MAVNDDGRRRPVQRAVFAPELGGVSDQRLLLRAAGIVLEPWGLDEKKLTKKVVTELSQLQLSPPPQQHPLEHRRDIPGVINPAVQRALKSQPQ